LSRGGFSHVLKPFFMEIRLRRFGLGAQSCRMDKPFAGGCADFGPGGADRDAGRPKSASKSAFVTRLFA